MRIELAIRIFILVSGLSSVGFGASLFISSNIGSDPFNVLMQGLSNVWGVTVGQSNIIVSLTYAIIIFFLDQKFIRVGTLIAVVAIGIMIDLGIYLLEPIFALDIHYAVRFITMLIGSMFIALGVAVIYTAKIGMVPNDALPVIISNQTNLPFKWVRVGYDLTAVLVGAMLGGVFGIGTVLCALITGPLISLFTPRAERVTNKIILKTIGNIK